MARDGIKHFDGWATDQFAGAAQTNLPAYFKQAIVINEAEGVRKGSDVAYVLAGAYIDDAGMHITRTIVNHYNNQFIFGSLQDSLYATKEKEVALIGATLQNKSSRITSFDINIKHLLAAVKDVYPDEISRDVASRLKVKQSLSDIENLRYSLNVDDDIFNILNGENDTSLSDTQFLDDGTEQTTDQKQQSFDKAVSILEEGGRILYNQYMNGVDPAANECTTREIARKILRDYQSDYDFAVLSDNLQRVFAYLQENETANYRDLMQLMTEITTPVL